MKFIFTSDRFSYIHPYLIPRRTNDYTPEEMKEADANTRLIKYDSNLLDKAIESSSGNVPRTQIGMLMVFPTVKNPNIKQFITSIFASLELSLRSEYSEKDDPTEFWSITDNGSVFGARFFNHIKKANERYDSKSVALYIAGCKSMTAEYLFEELIDTCYIESDKHDRRIVKENRDESEKYGFGNFNSFLIYDFSRHQFHMIGIKESQLYFERRKPNHLTDGGYSEHELAFSPSELRTYGLSS